MTCRRVLSTIRGCAATLMLLCGVAGAQSVLQITTPLFPLTPVGQSATANVQITVASGGNQVIYSAIQLAPGSSDYTLGTITGCVVDGTTPNVDGTTCTIPVTFQPTRPGRAASPQPIARTVALQVYDTENGNPQQYSLGLIGSGTMPLAVMVPGIISDLVGNDAAPQIGFGGDGGPASGAIFLAPRNMAVDSQGNIYISDTLNCVVRRVDAVTHIVSTYAGIAPSPTPNCGPGTDGTYPTGSALNSNNGIALDAAGNLYIADTGNAAIRMVSPVTGLITTVAGQLNLPGYGADGTPAVQAQLQAPTGIAVDGYGDLFIVDAGNYIVREVSPATGFINTVAGVPENSGVPSTETFGVPAKGFYLGNPEAVTVDSAGNLYIADEATLGVLEVSAATQNISLLSAASGVPTSLAVDASDTLYFTLAGMCGVYKLPQGAATMVPVAGNGVCIPNGDGGSALLAGLNDPLGVVVDGTGSFYILEADGVRFVDSTGTNPLPLAFGSQQIYAVSNPLSVLLFNGDVPLPVGATPNPLGVYFSGGLSSLFATVTPAGGAVDCSTATAAVSIPLSPAAYCSLSVTFTPTADVPYAGSTSLFEYLPGTTTQVTQAINLSGTGKGTAATASLTPTSATMTAGVAGGVATQSFTLTNTSSGAPLIVSAVSFGNYMVSGFSQTNNCSAPLAQNASCTIVVQYAPTVGGSVSQTLIVTDNVVAAQTTASITGVGVLPTATLTPNPLNFTGVVNESVQEQSFTLTNTSATAYLVVGAIYFPTGNGFTVDNTATTCISATVAPGANCTIAVAFGANALGSPTNMLTVLDNTAAGMETATVNGTAYAPMASLSVGTLSFSSTQAGGQSASQMVTLTNTGTWPLTIRSVYLTGNSPNAFLLAPNPCPASLAIGASCNVTVSFTPQAPGSFTAQVAILDDSGGKPTYGFVTQTISLSGTAPTPVQTSSFAITDTAFPSTPVSVGVTQNVMLTLNSASTVLKSIAMAQGFGEYVVNTVSGCTVDGITPNPAFTVCSINITFTPTSIGSLHNATLVVTTIESSQQVPYDFGLTGQSTGTIAALTPGIIGAYVASDGTKGGSNPMSGMGGPAINANVGFFGGFALDSAHNMYVADTYFAVIYKVSPQGIINLYAGQPFVTGGALQTLSGDGGPATAANLSQPPGGQNGLRQLALDAAGSLYVADSDNFFHTELRRIDAGSNIIERVMGTNPVCGSASDDFGDNCPLTQVAYNGLNGMAFGPDGNLYFSTLFGIHELNFTTNLVTVYAGTGSVSTKGSGADGGPAIGAAMVPTALTFDGNGNLLFIDSSTQVRKIDHASNVISTVAGVAGAPALTASYGNQPCTNSPTDTAAYHSTGNGGPATAATFCQLTGISTDPANNIYVVDFSASEIRRIDSGTGIIVEVSGQNSIAGIDYGDSNEVFDNNDGSARDASLAYPMNVLVDGSANVYEMGYLGNVRMINVSASALDFTPYFSTVPPYNRDGVGIGRLVGPQQVTVINAGNTGTVSFSPPFTTSPLFGISTADYVRDTSAADCLSTNAVLAPGTECPINIDFTPTVAGSPIQDTETINDTGGTQTITLIGYAGSTSQVTLTPGLLTFSGAVGAVTAAQNFTLTNNMPGAIGISSITLIGVNPNAFMAPSNCGTSLAANSSCQISVTFTAPALGNFLAQVSVVYTQVIAGSNGPIVFPQTLRGNLLGLGGVPEGQFIVSGTLSSPTNFGTVNVGMSSSLHSFNFASTGNVPLIVSSVSLTGPNANQFSIVSNTCSGPTAVSPTLAPGAGCLIGVQFTPTADSPTTPFTATINVADNAPDTPQQLTISGIGAGQPALQLNVLETITTADTVPPPVYAMQLNVMEAITTADTVPAPVRALQLNITEAITTADAASTTTTQTATTAQLEYSSLLLPVGSNETLTVAVSPTSATGTVNLYDGTTLLATGPLTGGSFTFSTTGLAPGVHTIKGFYLGSSTYAASSTHNMQIVVQTTLTVTAQSFNRAFATANPALTYQITGYVNGDTSAVLSGTPYLATAAVTNSTAGTYPITVVQNTLSAPGYYVLSFVPGTLTVNGGHAQTINFLAFPTPISLSVGNVTLTATDSSSLPITYTVAGPATLSGHNNLMLTGAGTVTVTASQSGSTTFGAATPVVQSFQVTP